MTLWNKIFSPSPAYTNRPPRSVWRTALFAGIIAIQVLLSLGFTKNRPDISVAYVIKNGPTFTLYWKENGKYFEMAFKGLLEAKDFASDTLMLNFVRDLNASAEMERIWTEDRADKTRIYWKSFSSPFLSQWTFDHARDAEYAHAMLLSGAYSRSPFGHALKMLPRQ